MKTLKLTTPLLSVLVCILTISADMPQTADSLKSGVINTILEQADNTIDTYVMGNDYSVGYLFSPNVAGEITHLSIKLPEVAKYTVSIWDADSYALLRQVDVHQEHGNWTTEEIAPLPVSSDKTYVICAFLPVGTKYYSASNLDLPISINEVQILKSAAAFGNTYPVDLIMNNAVFGFVDFGFEASPQ